MSGRAATRGRGRGEGAQPNRGRGAQFSVPTADSRPGRAGGHGSSSGSGSRGGSGRGQGGYSTEGDIFSQSSAVSTQANARIQKIEDETMKSVVTKASPGPKTPGTVQALPLRPGYGTQGRQVSLWSNYFEMVTPKDLMLFRYSIDIKPDEKGKLPTGKKLKRVIQLLVEQHFPQYETRIVTDYKSNLICRSELAIDNDKVYEVSYRQEDEDEPGPKSPTYMMRLKGTGTLAISQLVDYLSSTSASAIFGAKEEMIQALNIVLGHYPKTAPQIFSIGGNKHFRLGDEKMDLGAGLLAMRGFFVSVRAATSRLLLNVQVKHAACYQEGPLVKLIESFTNANGVNAIKLAKFLKKLRVQVTHIVKKNKAGKTISRSRAIDSLATPNDGNTLEHPPRVAKFGAGSKDVQFFLSDSSGQSSGIQQSPAASASKKGGKGQKSDSEALTGGRYISVYDFFKNTYGITIQSPNMPVINVGNRQNPSYLPSDVCVVEPGQQTSARLSPNQTQMMIKFAVRRPAENARSIVTNGARLLGIAPPTNKILSEYGISITPSLISVPGRVLTGPSVKYDKNVSAKAVSGSWNMRAVQFSTKSRLTSWTWIYFSTPGARNPWQNMDDFQHTLRQFEIKLREVGVNAAPITKGVRVELSHDNFQSEIDTYISRFASPVGRAPPQLLLVVLSSLDSAIYNRIKLACDVKGGQINVCVVDSKLAKNSEQYFANVGLKINLKLGGRNQCLDPPKLGIITEGKTMVVGIDVTHPSPGSASNAPSVAGVVASVDQWLGQWPAILQVQGTARQEMVSGLDGMFKSRLILWAKKNKAYPENILIYRDGVSEGQYEVVLKDELPLLRKACAEVYPANDTKKGLPRMTILIVGKRHHTRFYAQDKANADKSGNPENGTIVDRGVTEPRYWDFFLQAHSALQGTARPAHYFCVLDEIFRMRPARYPFQNAAEIVEDLTHNMCYLFGRATKAVSVCPPAYYADLVCERARCYLSNLYDATPSGSVASGAERDAETNDLQVHEKVKDTMFYI